MTSHPVPAAGPMRLQDDDAGIRHRRPHWSMEMAHPGTTSSIGMIKDFQRVAV